MRTKIIGIATALVILASLAAMVPMVSAVSQGDNFNHIAANTPDTVLVGQNVQFWNANVTLEKLDTGVWYYYAGPWLNGQAFNNAWDTTLTLRANDGAGGNTTLAVQTPKLPLVLKVGEKTVSTIALGNNLTIDVSGINLFGNDKVDLVINGPDGQIKNDTPRNPIPFTNITVTNLSANYAKGAFGIETDGWKIGTYTIQIKTKSDLASGLDLASETKSLTIGKGEIAITADKTSTVELETIKLTVTGVFPRAITVGAMPGSAYPSGTTYFGGTPNANVVFPKGVNDNPNVADADWFNHTIDEDGTRTYAVKFKDTGSFTIKVVDWTSGDTDSVDITVSEKAVTFDVPATGNIGEKITIKGTANTGTYVTVAVDNLVYSGLNNLPLDANKQFSKAIDTAAGTDVANAFSVPGSVRLKGFIDRVPTDNDVSNEVDDGTAVILMQRGALTAQLSSTIVAQKDDFTIKGTAMGTKEVDIIIVSPKGSGGYYIDGTFKGIMIASASVSETDHTFSKKITVGDNVDTGTYAIGVLSPGSDGGYGKQAKKPLSVALGDYSLTGKTQSELWAIIEDLTDPKLTDDLKQALSVKVQAGYVKLEPIKNVGVGEPLVINGTTNRKDGSAIVITVKGPKELSPQTVKAAAGKFNATFDTTDALVGTYTVKADDGDGNTDEALVQIVMAVPTVTPVATPVPTPVATPVPTPVATPVPTPVATPTPTPPGFEAVFAIAGLLAVAYLVLRRK